MGKFDLRIFEYEIINNSSPTIVYPTNLTNMVTKITKLRSRITNPTLKNEKQTKELWVH